MDVADKPSPLGEPAMPWWQLPQEGAAWLPPRTRALHARRRAPRRDRLVAPRRLVFARGRRAFTGCRTRRAWCRSRGPRSAGRIEAPAVAAWTAAAAFLASDDSSAESRPRVEDRAQGVLQW